MLFNAIVHGLIESSATIPTDRLSDDLQHLSQSLLPLAMSLPADVKMIRLGRTIGKNPRPLKVIFSSKITSHQFIKDFVTDMRSRAATDPPLLVSVVRDRTLMERQQVRQVYADLVQRRKNGENNIVVRHFNGVPSIVQANKDFQLNHTAQRHKHGSLLTSMTLNLGLLAIKSSGLTEIILTVTTHEEVVFSLQSSAVYLPPMSTLPDFESHTSSIEHLISSTNPTSFLLCGDYNLSLIKWSNFNQGLFASGTMSNTSTHLVDSFSSDTPTVQLANTPIVSPDSYHPPLFVSFSFPTPITAQHTHKYLDDSAVVFNDALLSSINKFVPIKGFSPSKFPKWTSTILKNLIITKKKAHSVYKRTKSISDYLVFSEYRAKCKRQSKVDYSAHIRHTEVALSSSPSKFWKFVNNLKQKPPIPSSLHLGNITSNTPTESANLFSTHFSSTFNSSAFQLPPF
ncbi:Reverse transcriptase domain-containing protein, partial [Aphis craccivora]